MYFGRVRAQRMPASPMRARLSRTGTGHRPQMHADECTADVNARARADVLHQHGVRHVRICGGGKGTARVGLRHGVYRFRPRRKRRPFHNDGAVQVLTALRGQIQSAFRKQGRGAFPHSLRGLHAGAAPNALAHDLAGRTADDKNISRAHPGCRQKLRHGLSRLGAHGLRQSHFNSLPARVSQHTGRFSLL